MLNLSVSTDDKVAAVRFMLETDEGIQGVKLTIPINKSGGFDAELSIEQSDAVGSLMRKAKRVWIASVEDDYEDDDPEEIPSHL